MREPPPESRPPASKGGGPRPKKVSEPPPLLTPKEIYDQLGEYVVGQEHARKVVSIAAYQHIRRIHVNRLRAENPEYKKALLKKSNILMIGPTGSGKTHIARSLAKVLEVPLGVVDATEYTEAGYYGKDVEVMVAELLFRQKGDVESAQRGIIFIDEFDKIASRQSGARTGTSRDIGGMGVQQSLLRILEGDKIFVPYNVTQHWNQHEFVQMDISEILFICGGAFSDMRGFEDRMIGGFGEAKAKTKAREVTTEELIKYGFIPELLGRLPIVVSLNEHDVPALKRILTEPRDALVREFQDMLALDGVSLDFDDAALTRIAEACLKKKTGARAARSIMQTLLLDTMFEAPSMKKRGKVVIDREYVENHLPRE